MAVISVGPAQTFTTIAAAVAAANNGDIIQVQAGTYTNDFASITKNITLQGVGGMVNLVATVQIPNGKAIFVTNGNITIDNFSFSGATVADANGAGIRAESGNLVLNNDYFFDNQDGLLAGGSASDTITINNSEFANNGVSDPNSAGYGYTHNIYVGNIGNLTINNSYFHDANIGHEIKSRAATTVIQNSRIFDGPNGTASYSIDLPNGGNAQIINNVIEQGPHSDNPVIVAFGEEGSVPAGSSLLISGNQILNDLNSSSARVVDNASSAVAQITGNQFFGLSAGQIAVGPNSQTNNSFLQSEPPLDTSHPFSNSSSPNPPPNVVPIGPTADMILRGTSGSYEIYNIGNNSVLGASALGQVGTDYQFTGMGNFNGDNSPDMILRSNITGSFEVYNTADNGIIGAADLGAVGLNWQLAGFGSFNGDGATDMMLRDSNTGVFELYDINHNAITGANPIGAVGLDWKVQGSETSTAMVPTI